MLKNGESKPRVDMSELQRKEARLFSSSLCAPDIHLVGILVERLLCWVGFGQLEINLSHQGRENIH